MTKIFILTLFILATNAQIYVGDDCVLANGSNGNCVEVRDCPAALEQIKNKQRPQICSFQGSQPVVCCQKESSNLVIPGRKSKEHCIATYAIATRAGNDVFLSAVGGENSAPADFIHMALLGYGAEANIVWACGGSLISKDYVLTAAHCLTSREFGQVTFVRLGDLNINRNDDQAAPQTFKVIKRVKHPDYKPPSQYHDIALIQLERPAEYTTYVKPACLNTDRIASDPYYTATGWGNLEFGGSTADHLQRVDLTEYSLKNCSDSYAGTPKRRLANGIVDDWQLCAGGLFKDTCQGDSGGPLQKPNQLYSQGYTIYGVTSFGKACGIGHSPGVYTRVSNYIGWIESVVWPN